MDGDLAQLLSLIEQTPSSPTKVGLLEEAIQRVDAAKDVDQGFALRIRLLSEALLTGFPDKLLAAFSWNLAQVDRDSQRFPESKLLWQYKWAISELCDFPQISRGQIEAVYHDITARFERNGASLRPIYSSRCFTASCLGDKDLIPELFAKWKKCPEGYLSDCRACDRNAQVSIHISLKHYKRALQLVKPILNGAMSCSSVPHSSLGNVLRPLLELNRFEEAAECHAKGLRLVANSPRFVSQQSTHLNYLMRVDRFPEALRLFERHLTFALECSSPLSRYCFYLSSARLMAEMKKRPQLERPLLLPKKFPLRTRQGKYDFSELAGWFEKEVRGLAQQFDLRAGNDYRVREVEEDLAEL